MLGLVTFLAASAAAAQQPALQKFSREDIVTLLQAEGYENVRLAKVASLEGVHFQKSGLTYHIFFYEDDDLQLYHLQKRKVPAARINEWNRDKKHSRAYLDSDGEAVIEADLLGDFGLTRDQVINFVKVFIQSATEFREFLTEGGRKKK